jgi:hypothetical protein
VIVHLSLSGESRRVSYCGAVSYDIAGTVMAVAYTAVTEAAVLNKDKLAGAPVFCVCPRAIAILISIPCKAVMDS